MRLTCWTRSAVRTSRSRLVRRRSSSCTHPGLAPLVGQQGANQGFTVDPVSLRPPTPPGGGDGSGIDDMALDPFRLQDAVDPEPVQPRFLDDDDGKDLPRPGAGFLLELG